MTDETRGTARNAKMIEIQMKAAAAYLDEALKAVRIASEAVESGEDDVNEKMNDFLTMQRMLSMGLKDANRMADRWTEYRMDRETD